nr:MAG TPA: hypothetical protein [Caudoviricetes sp.]
MLFESIPRGSIAAQLTAADMLARLQDHPNASIELHQAVTVIGNYIVDPAFELSDSEIKANIEFVAQLYS